MATVETPLITYNLAQRGRQYRGKERHFHLQVMAAAINSPETQERVKHRDMLGFYGHWPRLKFGMNPCEGGPIGVVEPALVTTHLSAQDDGTVQHRAEFLKTKAGQLASQLFDSKTGGFSSAIDEVKPEFFGFDYVFEPNYSTNRGYEITFDSASGNFAVGDMTLDAIMAAEYDDQLSGFLALVQKMGDMQRLTLQSMNRLQAENEDLMSRIVRQPSLDSTQQPMSFSKDPAEQLLRDIQTFRTARLPRLNNESDGGDDFSQSRLYRLLANGR